VIRFASILALLSMLRFDAVAESVAVKEIVSPAGAGAAEPFVAASKNGLVMSWLEPVPNTDRVALRFARYKAGTWSQPRTIIERNDLFVNWADFPSVIEDAKGVLFAHWLQKSGGAVYAYDVRMATSPDGGRNWSKPFLLNRDGKKNEHGFVSLVALPKSGVGATWLDGRNMPEGKEEGEMTLRYATVDSSGAIHSDIQLDNRTCECCTTDMALAAGRPVIAYRDRSADEVRDISVVRRAESGWTRPRLIHQDGWKIAGCPVNGPQVAAFGRNVAVTWFTAANDQQRVYAAFSEDGGSTFSKPVAIDDGKPAGRVDIVSLDSDEAFVVWMEQTAAGAEIRGRVVSRNLSAGPSIKIADSSAARAAGFPRAGRVGRDVFVTWTDQSAKEKRVRIVQLSF